MAHNSKQNYKLKLIVMCSPNHHDDPYYVLLMAIHQLNANHAFLQGSLHEEVFMS